MVFFQKRVCQLGMGSLEEKSVTNDVGFQDAAGLGVYVCVCVGISLQKNNCENPCISAR